MRSNSDQTPSDLIFSPKTSWRMSALLDGIEGVVCMMVDVLVYGED